MAKVYEGQISSAGLKFAIVASRFNNVVVEQLVGGATDAIVRTGGSEDDVAIYRCPGAVELPQVARKVVEKGGIDAVICVGAVIRGGTPHFDYVAGMTARGVGSLAGTASMPVSFGILTTDSIEQAIERSGSKAGNKGFDAAMAAIEMANLFKAIEAD